MKKRNIVIIVIVVLVLGFYTIQVNRNPCFGKSSGAKAKDNCYVKHAIENQDENYCFMLRDKYATWGSDNLAGTCFTEMAVVTGDISYCEKITGKYLDVAKRECYTATASAINNPSICTNSNDSGYCYSWVSYIKNDKNICTMGGSNDECLMRHETQNFFKDYYVCAKFATQKARDLCNQH